LSSHFIEDEERRKMIIIKMIGTMETNIEYRMGKADIRASAGADDTML
jgi:hypothetical protein